MKKLLLIVLLLFGVGVLVLSTGRQPVPFFPGSQSAARLLPGPATVGQYPEVFVDKSRPTQANGDYPGDSLRTLDGMVWYPGKGLSGPFPLIVYSHGFSSNRDGGAYLAEHLASLGHVVVAVNYPLTHFSAPGGPNVKDVVNQPGDVSFLIDTLLKQSATPGHVLQGLVDETRIGVTGISLGGLTTELVAYHPTMRDKRIGAALSIAGPTAIFNKVFFSTTAIPFMMLAGDIDALVPYASNALPVLNKIPGAQLVTIHNASHTGFAGTASPLRWLNNPDIIGCAVVKRRIKQAGTKEDSWYDLIGTAEQGVNHNAFNELCLSSPLPEAMNPLRQQMISSVVVSSFFQSVFATNVEEQSNAKLYLGRHLDKELAEASFKRAR